MGLESSYIVEMLCRDHQGFDIGCETDVLLMSAVVSPDAALPSPRVWDWTACEGWSREIGSHDLVR
jgi:hypothetical protein